MTSQQQTRREYPAAGYFLTVLFMPSGGAAPRREPVFCIAPRHSARYESVPHTGFAVFPPADCRCFLILSVSCFMTLAAILPVQHQLLIIL